MHKQAVRFKPAWEQSSREIAPYRYRRVMFAADGEEAPNGTPGVFGLQRADLERQIGLERMGFFIQ